MKYLLLMYADESIVSKYSKEDFQAAASMQPGLSGLPKTWADFVQEISASGALISNSENIVTTHGVRLFADITQRGELKHYRFYGRKVMQYRYSFVSIQGSLKLEIPIDLNICMTINTAFEKDFILSISS